MTRLFGVPLGPLAVVFAVVLGIALALIAVLALRNRVLLRLGIRNATRRRARSALIVLGLILGTALFAAALATGDTMSHTIRSSAIKSLGYTDELVQAKGAKPTLFGTDTGAAGACPRIPDRPARTVIGLVLMLFFVLPTTRWLLGSTKGNFSTFILAG